MLGEDWAFPTRHSPGTTSCHCHKVGERPEEEENHFVSVVLPSCSQCPKHSTADRNRDSARRTSRADALARVRLEAQDEC